MDCFEDRITLDNFKSPSTYQNDYKSYCDYRKEIYKRPHERFERPAKERPLPLVKDHESFAKWNEGVHIPFDLLIPPKPIVGTNPHHPFQKLVPISSTEREEAIRNKPRIYMTPAFCMDDVEDPKMKELLCSYLYTTEWRTAEKEALENWKSHDKDDLINSVKLTTTTPVGLQTELYKPIAETFQRQGKEWDTPQQRGFTDPTKEFWIHKDPPVQCGACVDVFERAVPEESKQKIAQLLAKDLLRFPHDCPPPTYTGYKVRHAKGVPLGKGQLSCTQPLLSTYQAMTCRSWQIRKNEK